MDTKEDQDLGEVREQLNCTGCGRFRDFEREKDTVVRCSICGKRHSNNSLFVAYSNKMYSRDEEGNLLNGVTVP